MRTIHQKTNKETAYLKVTLELMKRSLLILLTTQTNQGTTKETATPTTNPILDSLLRPPPLRRPLKHMNRQEKLVLYQATG